MPTWAPVRVAVEYVANRRILVFGCTPAGWVRLAGKYRTITSQRTPFMVLKSSFPDGEHMFRYVVPFCTWLAGPAFHFAKQLAAHRLKIAIYRKRVG